MSNVLIRPAMACDEGPIAALHASSWREQYGAHLPSGFLGEALEADRARHWRGIFAAVEPGRLVLTAVAGERFAGFLLCRPDPEDPARDLIVSLHVAPEARGQGIGTRLLAEGALRLAAMGRGPAVLWVVEDNARARALYTALGGVEGAPEPHALSGQGAVPMVPVHWESLAALASAARGRAAAKLPAVLPLEAVPAQAGDGADHPVASGPSVAMRVRRRLGEAFGLTDFGVNLVELPPRGTSTVPHSHSAEDELVFVLEGHPVLVLDGVEHPLAPGSVAGYAAGTGRVHHMENRTDAPVRYLEIGSRRPDLDICDYAGEDLLNRLRADGLRAYTTRDGRPVAPRARG